jgi:phosphoserine phosphatase
MLTKNTTPVNEFSSSLWDLLSSQLEAAAAEAKGPKIAAFDADGTLWDADAGETFFDWQIKNNDLAEFKGRDPWAHYKALKKPDPRVGYVWLAQINEGKKLSEVREWAAQCFAEKKPWPVFESQRRLIEKLRSLGFEIYVVTASVKWAVEPVAALLRIDYDHVIGIETKVVDGVVTKEVKPPITWREGKAEGLLAKTGGVRPILASGNTFGDIALLECATHIRLALSTQDQAGGLFDEETKLVEHASEKRWHMHAFRAR